MNEYEAQATEFATKHGVELKVINHNYGLHFEGDTQERRIFNLDLTRNGETYNFDFGQSINDSYNTVRKSQSEAFDSIDVFAGLTVVSLGMTISRNFTISKKHNFKLTPLEVDNLAEDMKSDFDYKKEQLNKKGRKYQRLTGGGNLFAKSFKEVILNAIKRECEKMVEVDEETNEIIEPTMYDVLTCLTKYDPETFEDFCDNFGYDQDSRSAERTYNAVCEEFANVEILFSDIMEELSEIQ